MHGLTLEQTFTLCESVNPFDTPAALAASNYSAVVNGALTRVLDWKEPVARAKMSDNAMRAFLLSDAFSCVAAKAAVASGGYRFGYYPDFPSTKGTAGLARDLTAFVAERPSIGTRYASFVAVFESRQMTEKEFEGALWRQLAELSELDAAFHAWDPNVSSDPQNERFAFSFAKRAFFVVGMHAASSRRSRRFFLPAVAFNMHQQFEDARLTGRYSVIQRLVRANEYALQDSINPQLAEFGTRSEARQYSGRDVGAAWQCPFHPKS